MPPLPESARSPTPRRRFTLLDAMILVAATAFGCAVDAWIDSLVRAERGMSLLAVFGELFNTGQFAVLFHGVTMVVLPVAAAWTLALIPLRLLPPRPRFRRLASQPGWMACCGFAMGLGCLVTFSAVLAVVWGPAKIGQMVDLLPLAAVVFAPTILSAWLAMVLNRRWRAEPTWLDRSGRVLGVFWVAMSIVGVVLAASLF